MNEDLRQKLITVKGEVLHTIIQLQYAEGNEGVELSIERLKALVESINTE